MGTTTWFGATPRRADNVERAPHISEAVADHRAASTSAWSCSSPSPSSIPFPGVDLTPSHYDGADRAAEE